MSNEFEEKLKIIVADELARLGNALSKSESGVYEISERFIRDVKSLIKDSLPKKRKESECTCGPYEFCGCVVKSFNSAIEEMEKKLGVDGE